MCINFSDFLTKIIMMWFSRKLQVAIFIEEVNGV